MDGAWSLVGRDVERRAVEHGFGDPEVGGVVLAGDAGVGRTRLAREALRVLTVLGCRPEWLPAKLAPESVPFGAVGQLLPSGTRPDDHPAAVIGAVAARYEDLGGPTAVGLVVDDAHLLDGPSACLVAQLVSRGLVFAVVTVERNQPVPAAISALWLDGPVHRLEVPPLTDDALDTLLDDALGGPVDSITRQRLRKAAAGRPAVLRELLTCGRETDALHERYGVWHWRGPIAGSRRVVERIGAQLTTCEPEVRAVLEVVACGEPLALHAVEQLADSSAIAAAERSGLITVERDGHRVQVRLSNPLHADAIREHMPVVAARRIWGQLAEVTAATPMRRRGDPLQVAVWQLEACAVTVPQVLVPAGRQVITSDPVLAEWCARTACDRGVGEPAYLLLAEVLEYGGRAKEAAEVLAAAPGRGTGTTGGPDAGTRAAVEATVYYWGLGQLDRAQEALDASAEPGHDVADALRTWLLLFNGSYAAALDVARQVLAQPRPSDQATVWAVAGGAGAAGLLGRLDEAMRLRRRGLAVAHARDRELPWALAQVECAACAALYFTGHVDAATEVAEAGYRRAATVQEPLMLGIWAMLRGVLAAAAGRVVTAQALQREAIVLLEETDTRLVDFCMAELAAAAAIAGDPGRVTHDWLTDAEDHASPANLAFQPWRERARAWVLAGSGATSEAIAALRQAAGSAGCPTAEAHLLYDIARLGDPASVATRLSVLTRSVEGPFVAALATSAAALAARTRLDGAQLAGLSGVADTLAGLGHTLLAAEVTRFLAHGYRAVGLRARAQLASERATALLERCERLRTPLLALNETFTRLTPREREIALLAATRTSKDIATHLGVAVSTVNNHLAKAYAKLGITSRNDLTALLDPDQPSRTLP